MKKILGVLLSAVALFGAVFFSAGCSDDTIYVQTNAFFAPFEYYEGTEIVGVDVDIMNKVGEKMGKKVVFKDGDFGIIIDTVHQGKTADAGAAGITITDERKEKVDFSIPYYTSVQYVIWEAGNADFVTSKATDGTDMILWENLGGKKIGVQLDTTGNLYVQGEIDGVDFDGVLKDSGAECKKYESAQMAVEAMFGSDANWGRVLCAVGYAGADVDVTKVDVDFRSKNGEISVCRGGSGVPFSEEEAKEVLSADEIEILIGLGDGKGKATAWGCDLTYEYVKINGDYRT